MLQHQFGVVAAGFGLDHGGDARRGQPRQQHRGLDLGRRHRRAVEDRQRIARAMSVSGRRPPSPLAPTLAPISSRGSSTRRIGLPRSDASPSKIAVMGSRPPPPSPAGSRCRNCRNRAELGLANPATPTPRTDQANHRFALTFAPSARMALAVSSTSSPSSRPEIRGFDRPPARPKSGHDAKSTCRRERGPSRSEVR